MGDHLVLCADHLITAQSLESMQGSDSSGSSLGSPCSQKTTEVSTCVVNVDGVEEQGMPGEEEPLIQTSECRICQEEDTLKNLEVPCACSGSLKFAHRKCVQRWCNEKGDVTCEICNKASHLILASEILTFIIEDWTISGAPIDLHDPRLLAVAASERQFLEAEYDADTNAGGAAFCRSAALILMGLLFLRHALALPDSDDEDDASAFFSLFLLRAAGFLLPCYIMAWAISILQRRRQRQEAAALAATEVAFMIQAGQHRGLQFRIAPGPAVTPHQGPLQ
ncbi:E3 ubiquitin-protein ligase MARCH4 [Morus notabilis]|uniref:E3 ubiquitin-protein ligase MARCH4 n=1 Tax=Morus notabilis TaxID=981085 RepID=W9RAB2_9ROSA|nr:E3 ubiquitin-protein ligase MARCH4 [Morus notabilis]